MGRPIYSFEFTQAGSHMIVDACVPVAVGHRIFELGRSAAQADRASIASQRPKLKLAKEPELQVRSLDMPKVPKAGNVAKKQKTSPTAKAPK
jgi:hypothetical protein